MSSLNKWSSFSRRQKETTTSDEIFDLFSKSINHRTKKFSLYKFFKELDMLDRNLSVQDRFFYKDIMKLMKSNLINEDSYKKFRNAAITFGCFCAALFLIASGTTLMPFVTKSISIMPVMITKSHKLFGYAPKIALSTVAGAAALLAVASFVGARILNDKEYKELEGAINSSTNRTTIFQR